MQITVPHDQELEQRFLGDAVFGNRAPIEELAQHIKPEHFYDHLHQRIWAAAVAVGGGCLTVDSVNKILRAAGEDEARPYLVDLQGNAMGIHPYHHIPGLRELALQRELIDFGADTQLDASVPDPTRSARDRLEAAEVRLCELAERGSNRRRASTMAETMRETRAMLDKAMAAEGTSGIATGVSAIDRRLNGLQDGELIIIAGRPGMGKTAAALTLAINAGKAGKKVRIVSLEMLGWQLGQRLAAYYSGISVQNQRKPRELSNAEHRRLAEAENKVAALPLFIDDGDGQTVAQIRSEARRQKRREGLDLLIVDYLGLIKPSDPRAQKVHQIEEITTGLKRLAKELRIPVVLLAQLNRGVEARDDKRPGLADLRDSGSIEQDADVVLMLYRAEYYLAKEEPDDQGKWPDWSRKREAARGKADIITAKFRQGETGTDTVRFDGARQVFADLEGERE